MIDCVDRLGRAHAPDARATVGMIEARPNSRNTVPGACFLTVEFRHPDSRVLAQLDAALREQTAAIARNLGLTFTLEQIFDYAPVPFAPECIGTVRRAAEMLGLPHADIVSGAGHDACYVARVAPTGMIFIPCIGGVSHNEAEAIEPHWADAGANVLLHAVLATANRP